jgi:hypothetical protein
MTSLNQRASACARLRACTRQNFPTRGTFNNGSQVRARNGRERIAREAEARERGDVMAVMVPVPADQSSAVTSLAYYDGACRAIAEAKNIDDVKTNCLTVVTAAPTGAIAESW